MKRYSHILMAAVLLLWPSLASANGLIYAVSAYRNTLAFWFVFAVVVLLEAVCVRLLLRSIHLVSALGRIFVLNAASSVAGYVLMQSPLRPSFMYVWQQAIPFFFLTLSIELPMLLLLFRKSPASWRRKLLYGTFANVLSYTFLILAEEPVEAVWLDRLRLDDQRIVAQWVDKDLLVNAPGGIYSTESGPGLSHRLRHFNLRKQRWYPMRKCPPIYPQYWDIEGDVVAFKLYQEGQYSYRDITVCRLPDFEMLAKISLTNAVNLEYGWGLQISPDRTKLAVLIPLHEISAPLSGSSYRRFGTTCELVVYDIKTAQIVGVCPRKASRNLCWLPDSQGVLFTSLRNASLYDFTMLEKDWKKKYPDAEKQFSDAPTYSFDIRTGSVDYFGEMKSVQLAAQVGKLAYATASDTICLLDPATSVTNAVRVGHLGFLGITISPDAKRIFAHFFLSPPFSWGYPAIADLTQPERRHLIDTVNYRLDWTTEVGGQTTSPTLSSPEPRVGEVLSQ